ncbi:hypothetical protein PPERSA_09399 [Pseudocohnilembus persalinus]|uniref:Uncharacterized protein n=1 Tax=Pseudocohnilembus persalinus TaxID=266149 RepID=A0A0V0R515_PSEPJ|nr:hypothetical protein PPERSA_09399 [Pseudocohnilembus persalinus]|eukprot:KRX09569.1 hypothetical protein PPERSA_09399 [Pseudocohnilembus persalinus]
MQNKIPPSEKNFDLYELSNKIDQSLNWSLILDPHQKQSQNYNDQEEKFSTDEDIFFNHQHLSEKLDLKKTNFLNFLNQPQIVKFQNFSLDNSFYYQNNQEDLNQSQYFNLNDHQEFNNFYPESEFYQEIQLEQNPQQQLEQQQDNFQQNKKLNSQNQNQLYYEFDIKQPPIQKNYQPEHIFAQNNTHKSVDFLNNSQIFVQQQQKQFQQQQIISLDNQIDLHKPQIIFTQTIQDHEYKHSIIINDPQQNLNLQQIQYNINSPNLQIPRIEIDNKNDDILKNKPNKKISKKFQTNIQQKQVLADTIQKKIKKSNEKQFDQSKQQIQKEQLKQQPNIILQRQKILIKKSIIEQRQSHNNLSFNQAPQLIFPKIEQLSQQMESLSQQQRSQQSQKTPKSKKQKNEEKIQKKNLWKNFNRIFTQYIEENKTQLQEQLKLHYQKEEIDKFIYHFKYIFKKNKVSSKFSFAKNFLPILNSKQTKHVFQQKQIKQLQINKQILRLLLLRFLRKDFLQACLHLSRIKNWDQFIQQKYYIIKVIQNWNCQDFYQFK